MTHDPRDLVLDRARQLNAFREALARRHAPALTVLRAEASSGILCRACFDAAARAMELKVERLDPEPEEVGVFEPYEVADWQVHRATDEDDGDDELVVEEVDRLDRAKARVVHRQPVRYGFTRLAHGDDLIYIWLYEWGGYDEANLCIATRHRASWERLVSDAELRHVAHERSRPGLVILGKCGERRARAEEVPWDQVLLPAGLRDDIQGTVSEFFASRELYRRHKIAYRRGILLAGPPGNGKTTILKAIRTTAGVPVVQVLIRSEAERGELIDRAFARAAVLAPCVLCFEDVDALVEDGPALSLFLDALDGLAPLDGILVVATTNRPDRIDPAIARRPSRFDRVWSIPAPDRGLREHYLAAALGGDGPAHAAARLAGLTEGFSIAFLKEVVIQARFAAVRRKDERIQDGDLDAAYEVAAEHVRLATRGLEERGAIGFTRA
jgi:hypothetical protein